MGKPSGESGHLDLYHPPPHLHQAPPLLIFLLLLMGEMARTCERGQDWVGCVLAVTSFVVLFLMCPGCNGCAAPRVERRNGPKCCHFRNVSGFLKTWGREIFEEE